MTRIIFIGATGTDIGKTHVTCMLVRQLRAQGFKVRAIKPVISGFDEQAIEQTDSGKLLLAMDIEPTLDKVKKISPWRFEDPLPPHLAAEQAGRPLNLDHIVDFCQAQAEETLDFLLIEGVGGIMTPLNYEYTTLDLMTRLGCPCLLVTGSALGTLSHSLTAVTCLKQHGIEINALVISESLKNYTDFDTILRDVARLLPDIAVKKIRRNRESTEIFSG